MATTTRRIDELAVNEVAEALKSTDVVIVPVGAVEPHGHHAPMGSDTFIATTIADRLAEASGGLVFTALPLGIINLGYDFRYMPGTVSIESKILIDLYRNIGTELARSGFRRLVFVNGHAPNTAVLHIAAYEMRERAPIEAGVLEWWAAAPAEIEAIKGFNFASHGDEIETSLVLASEGRRFVDLGASVVNSRTLDDVSAEELAVYKAKVPFTRTLDERWVGRSGNMGDPRRAREEHGERIIGRTVEMGLQLLEALARQLARRAHAPSGKEEDNGHSSV